MSSGGSSRVSIPSSLKKTIQDIKEIARNHSDDEILAMLEECAMDPNETAQKLLYQGVIIQYTGEPIFTYSECRSMLSTYTFHEVKRKRDRRKENMNNREPTDSRWKPGMQGRGIRGGRGSYYSRYQSHDAGDISGGKEDRAIQAMEKATTSPSSYSMQETENKSGVFAARFKEITFALRLLRELDMESRVEPGSCLIML
ncbi:hypothetical protein Taro_021733 [Colocasia esculenta]|uniref:GBF-interacting protein 1 N-terminal domain-containing protein n=1 Tax=Colocasia esculenta TaxID=4460 RepID=A0A843V5W1_COLES|nr:hypothetical protein [Colocasia esculenta]